MMVTKSLVALLGALAMIAAACTTDDDDAATTPSGTLERYEGYESDVYAEPAHWICHPDDDGDLCSEDLAETAVAADGTLTVHEWEPAGDAPVDCFYVYPTISLDETTYSDLDWDVDEEGYAVRNQVARLGEVCNVYAPVYRQLTLPTLIARLSGDPDDPEGAEESPDDPSFPDVLDAWSHYMANHNDGRGVVLVGHSQGSAMLIRLLQEEIEPNDDVRDHLVSAYLGGWSVNVPEGEVVGDDFEDIPLCESEDQFGCIVTWVSFRATDPPPDDTFFGRPRFGEGFSGCVNPAALDGGSAELRARFPANRDASILTDIGLDDPGEPWVDEAAGEITARYVTVPGMLEGECVSHDGLNYLSVTVHSDPADLRVEDITGDLTPQWGLHLVDMNLVMGNLLELLEHQTDAYLAAR